MRRAGRIVGYAQGVAVLRSASDDPPSIGATVLDADLDPAGNVVDVFGPVTGPYLAVSPNDAFDPQAHLGDVVYLR